MYIASDLFFIFSLSCLSRNILGLKNLLHSLPTVFTVLLDCVICSNLNLSGSSWLHWQLEHVTNSQTLSYVRLPGIWTWKSGFSYPGSKQIVVHRAVFNGFSCYCFHSVHQMIIFSYCVMEKVLKFICWWNLLAFNLMCALVTDRNGLDDVCATSKLCGFLLCLNYTNDSKPFYVFFLSNWWNFCYMTKWPHFLMIRVCTVTWVPLIFAEWQWHTLSFLVYWS